MRHFNLAGHATSELGLDRLPVLGQMATTFARAGAALFRFPCLMGERE